MWRAIVTVAIIVLVVVPALDLAWHEPLQDQSPGARCPLYANPAAVFEPLSLVVALAAECLLPFEPPDHFPLMSPSIFIPPRL